MSERRTRRVFGEMLREEWRLHTYLFGGRRFAAFPLLITLLVAGTVELLVVTGTSLGTVIAGLHALALVFGLHTGSIGFVGRDALQNLLGDLTLLVFSARTLPLSRRRLLGVFVVKDVLYYAILFLLPMALGVLPAVLGPQSGALAGSGTGTVGLLWLTLTGTFVLGIGVTIAGIGITSYGVSGLAVGTALGVGIAGAWVAGVPFVDYTPYGVFLSPTPARLGAAVLLVGTLFVVWASTFSVEQRRDARAVSPAFSRWQSHLGDPVTTKTLLDVHRSSGGLGKVLFSAAVLTAVTVALVDLTEQITGVSPSVGVSFGTILGLSGFTTYNWLTQFDDVDSYRVLPLAISDVFRAKFRAFLILGPLVGLGFYVLVLAWRGAPPREALAGAVVLVGVACYIFGVTVYLTGFSPNEFLFDTLLFAVFGLATVVPLVPILVVGFTLTPISLPTSGALVVGGVALAGLGIVLYRFAVPKWTHHQQDS